MTSSRLLLTAAALIVLGVTACGTAGTAGTTSTPPSKVTASPLSTAAAALQFAAAADRICAIQNQREAALGPGLVNADIVTTAHLPKAAAYLEKIISIKTYGLPQLRQLAAAGPPADRPARQAFVLDFQKVTADYQAAASAAHQGNLTAFRADFGKVAPHGQPTGPDLMALIHAARAFPFKSCGKNPGL